MTCFKEKSTCFGRVDLSIPNFYALQSLDVHSELAKLFDRFDLYSRDHGRLFGVWLRSETAEREVDLLRMG